MNDGRRTHRDSLSKKHPPTTLSASLRLAIAGAMALVAFQACSNATVPDAPHSAADVDLPGNLYACIDASAALVTTGSAALRADPRIDAPVLAVLDAAQTVVAVGACPCNGYYQVTANGVTGWVCGNHLDKTSSTPPTTDGGTQPDAGSNDGDAGATGDHGSHDDAGTTTPPGDHGGGGTSSDAGATTPPDHGGSDAGSTPEADAGCPADAGTPGGQPDAGGGGPVPPSGKLFVGYYQSWSDTWQSSGANTTLAKLPGYVNVVNLSFMTPDASYVKGSMSLSGTGLSFPYDGPTLHDAITALHQNHPGTRVLVSVGGATYWNWASFAPKAIADFVADFGIDGVDLDYEPVTANCTSNGTTVSCPSDAEFVSVVQSMKAKLPAGKWLTIAAWSVGAYGEGQWATATPTGSAYTGIALAVLKNATTAAAIDLVNVMSYDASPVYSPTQALAAYKHYYSGRIAMGVEVPPEAWGGHVETLAEIDALAAAVHSSGAAGIMLWSIQKQGSAQQFATQICNDLGLSGCSVPML